MDIIRKDNKNDQDTLINIMRQLINMIYMHKMAGINFRINNIFVNKNKVYIGSAISQNNRNIKLLIVKINYLKSIKKSKNTSLSRTCFSQCSVCKNVNTQHKLKCCGAYICVQCSFNNACSKNSCDSCGKQIVKKNIKMKKTYMKKETCSICLEECNTKIKSCGHYFHKKCIYESLKKKNSCPMCRKELINSSENTEKLINMPFELDLRRSGLVDIFIKKM